MKRVLPVLVGLFLLLLAVIVLWQPAALQRKVITIVAAKVAETTPYRLTVQDVSGNFFTHFALNGIRVRAENDENDLVAAKDLKIGVSWLALLQKKVVVDHVLLDQPVIRLRMDKNRR